MTQLVAEVNRRYGIIKRQELQEYYRVIAATKVTSLDVAESNYTNNDLDILNEAMEFEEKAPSDEFIKFKSSIADPSTPVETKINKLTDYRILQDFRTRIQDQINIATNVDMRNGPLSIVERVRSLKKAVTLKTSKSEKYDMIIKAIEESSAMDQSSNDIYMCFHELVLVPLSAARQMHHALRRFLLNIFAIVNAAADGWQQIHDHPILKTLVRPAPGGAGDRTLLTAIGALSRNEITTVGNNLIIMPDTVLANGGNIVNGSTGHIQTLLMQALLQFCTNSGDLVKMDISTTKRISIDLSEYQKLCEHLVANTKFMADKFVGLVPADLMDRVMNVNSRGVAWLEQDLLRKMFNKANKNEKDREVLCVDNLYKLMPVVSDIVFNRAINAPELITRMILQKRAALNGHVESKDSKPVIRDAFMIYRSDTKSFGNVAAAAQVPGNSKFISNLLFDASADKHLDDTTAPAGIIQEFNTLIANYMNDLYDTQSRKIYTKVFANFAGSALIDALNGQSFADFSSANPAVGANYYTLPKTQVVLSSTIAYVMKIMSNRVHPVTGMKVHEITSLEEISPHMMEKYRSMIPMYLRIFKAFLARCKVYRKLIGHTTLAAGNLDVAHRDNDTNVSDAAGDAQLPFVPDTNRAAVNQIGAPGANGNERALDVSTTRDTVCLYIDEVVNGLTSLVQDATAVQQELLESDPTVSLYFDVKKDFTKNYFLANKEYPFAPLSIIAMGFKQNEGVVPLSGASITNNKFAYGLRCLLADDFKLDSTKVPYLKRLIGEFNGYTTKTNNIPEAKFNDVLRHVSRAASYIYDLRFFNGIAITRRDPLSVSQYDTDQATNLVNAVGLASQAVLQAAQAAAPNDPAAARALASAQEVGRVVDPAIQVVAANPLEAVVLLNTLTSAQVAILAPVQAAGGPALLAAISNARALATFQENRTVSSALTVIESVNSVDSRNKIADYVKTLAGVVAPAVLNALQGDTNPRARVIMVNILDLNIVPINVHSLMREIPLANLYNYAMTFDNMVDSIGAIPAHWKALLVKPYAKIELNNNDSIDIADAVNGARNATFDVLTADQTALRYVGDVLFTRLLKVANNATALARERFNERANSKLFRNLLFLSLAQYAIKTKVKSELEFINTRVVTDTNAVSNVITNAVVDVNGAPKTVADDDMFQF
jgi:hypothetical protein